MVGLFGLAVRLGLHRLPLFNKVFSVLYSVYRQYIEARPVDGSGNSLRPVRWSPTSRQCRIFCP